MRLECRGCADARGSLARGGCLNCTYGHSAVPGRVPMGKPRVIIADDHTMLVEAFEKLLAPECEIVAKVADGRALVAAAKKLRPDVVVLDLTMPLLNGLDAARQIRAFDRSIRLVFVTMNE